MNYETHIPTLSLPDINDRHVLAAAIEARAPVIVTFNLSDFPAASLQQYGIQAVHPDAFLAGLCEEQRERFMRGLKDHRAALRNPPKTAVEYIQTLRAVGLKRLAVLVEPHAAEL